MGLDNAGNQVLAARTGFIYDVTAPSAILTPSQRIQHVQISSLTGTAVDWVNLSTDSYSGLAPAGVKIQIVDVTDEYKIYNGVGSFPNNTDDTWLALNTTDYGFIDAQFGVKLASAASWAYPPVGQTWPPALTDGHRYKVRVRAADRSGNTGAYVSPVSERQFIYDNSAPTTTVTMPGALYYTALPSLQGDFTETISGINPVNGVQVVVKNNVDQYWNGASWDAAFSGSTHWKNATAIYSSSWTYTDANLVYELNNIYPQSMIFTVYVRGKDIVGNKNMVDTPAPATGVQFTMDHFLPASRSTYPAVGGGAVVYLSSSVSNISGTATDDDDGIESGLNNVYLRVRRYDSLGTPCY